MVLVGFKPDLWRPTGFLQCFGTVGSVIWPVKIIPKMTYNVTKLTNLHYYCYPQHSLHHISNGRDFNCKQLTAESMRYQQQYHDECKHERPWQLDTDWHAEQLCSNQPRCMALLLWTQHDDCRPDSPTYTSNNSRFHSVKPSLQTVFTQSNLQCMLWAVLILKKNGLVIPIANVSNT